MQTPKIPTLAKSFPILFAALMVCFLTLPASLADAPVVPAGTGAQAVAPAASTGGTQAAAVQQPSAWGMMTPLLVMFAVVYFMMIRPQQKKIKEHQKMMEAIKSGDDVVTASGILGRVAGINDKVVTIEIASNVHVKMLKSQVSQIIKGQVKELA